MAYSGPEGEDEPLVNSDEDINEVEDQVSLSDPPVPHSLNAEGMLI